MKGKHIVAFFCVLMLGLSALSFSLLRPMVYAATSCAANCAKATVMPTAKATAKATIVPTAKATPKAPLNVQKIAVVNRANFVVFFSVGTRNLVGVRVYSGSTNYYATGQSRMIDASNLNLAPGADMFPHVNTVIGNMVDGPSVRYAANGRVATYEVRGTALSYTVTLLS